MKHFFTILLVFSHLVLGAQAGEWTVYRPTAMLSSVATIGDTVIVGSSGSGLVLWDGDDNRSLVHTGNSDIPSDTISHLGSDAAGNWWIGYQGGLARYDGMSWQSWPFAEIGLPSEAAVKALKAAPDGALYAATTQGVAIYRDGAWSVLNTDNSGILTNNIWDVAFGPDGKVYYGSIGSGIVVQDGDDWTNYTTSNTGVNTMSNVFSLTFAADGSLWAIGGPLTNGLGFRLIQFSGDVWTGYNFSGIGLAETAFFQHLYADDFGVLWMTTSRGVSRLQDGTWVHFYANDIGFVPDAIRPAVDGEGRLWVVSGAPTRFDGQASELMDTGLPGHCGGAIIDGIAEDLDGNIWMGAYQNSCITRTDGENWDHYYPTELGASNNEINTIHTDPQGRLWFGLDNGDILMHQAGVWTLFDTCRTVFFTHWIRKIATAPNGDLWFAFLPFQGNTIGLARYTGSEWTFFTQLPINASINGLVVQPDGHVWVSTSVGLLRYDGMEWVTYTTSNSGLPSDSVFDLVTAPDGSLWGSTNAGLFRFDGQEWSVINTGNSALPSNNTRRMAFDDFGGLYLGYFREDNDRSTVAVQRDGTWTELEPPGWNPFFSATAFLVDSENRFWFAESNDDVYYRYDPMLVSTAEPAATDALLQIYPNPTSAQLTLQWANAADQPGRLLLYNLVGQLVYQQKISRFDGLTQTLDLSPYPPGVYWLTVQQGGRKASTKVVRQ